MADANPLEDATFAALPPVAMDSVARVVINEYLEIAKAFFGDDDPKFINAVLDAMARETRSGEFESDRLGRAGRP